MGHLLVKKMSSIEEDIAELKTKITTVETQITSKQEFLSSYVRSKSATEEDLFRNDPYFRQLKTESAALNQQLIQLLHAKNLLLERENKQLHKEGDQVSIEHPSKRLKPGEAENQGNLITL